MHKIPKWISNPQLLSGAICSTVAAAIKNAEDMSRNTVLGIPKHPDLSTGEMTNSISSANTEVLFKPSYSIHTRVHVAEESE